MKRLSQEQKDFWVEEHTQTFASLDDCKPEHGAFFHVIEFNEFEKTQADLQAANEKLGIAREALSHIESFILASSEPNAITPTAQEIYEDRYMRIKTAREALAKIGEC